MHIKPQAGRMRPAWATQNQTPASLGSCTHQRQIQTRLQGNSLKGPESHAHTIFNHFLRQIPQMAMYKFARRAQAA